MYFGVQMYGVSKEWKQDPEGFLKKIYEAGYRQIEPCLGFRVDARDYGFWIPEDLEQAMPLLAKYHIEVHAVHIFLDEYHYERELAILTELAQKYHISWFVVKSPARLTKDVLDETLQDTANWQKNWKKPEQVFWSTTKKKISVSA